MTVTSGREDVRDTVVVKVLVLFTVTTAWLAVLNTSEVVSELIGVSASGLDYKFPKHGQYC